LNKCINVVFNDLDVVLVCMGRYFCLEWVFNQSGYPFFLFQRHKQAPAYSAL